MNSSTVLVIQQLQTEGNVMSFYATGKLLGSMKQKTSQRKNNMTCICWKKRRKKDVMDLAF